MDNHVELKGVKKVDFCKAMLEFGLKQKNCSMEKTVCLYFADWLAWSFGNDAFTAMNYIVLVEEFVRLFFKDCRDYVGLKPELREVLDRLQEKPDEEKQNVALFLFNFDLLQKLTSSDFIKVIYGYLLSEKFPIK
jgi:hypothetical protein